MKTKPPVKLPKGRVESLYVDRNAVLVNSRAPDLAGDRLIHTACIPRRTRQEAREIVKLRGMSEKEIRHLVWNLTPTNADVARGVYSRIDLMNAILEALHLIP